MDRYEEMQVCKKKYTDELFLEVLSRIGPCTSVDVQLKIGCSYDLIRRALARLEREGKVERTIPPREMGRSPHHIWKLSAPPVRIEIPVQVVEIPVEKTPVHVAKKNTHITMCSEKEIEFYMVWYREIGDAVNVLRSQKEELEQSLVRHAMKVNHVQIKSCLEQIETNQAATSQLKLIMRGEFDKICKELRRGIQQSDKGCCDGCYRIGNCPLHEFEE